MEHGGQVIVQVNDAALFAGSDDQSQIAVFSQLVEGTADRGTGNTPAFRQFGIADKWLAGAAAVVDHRPLIRAPHPFVPVHRMQPQVEKNVQFGAFPHADQFVQDGNREEEKAGILLTGSIIVKYRVAFLPGGNFKLNDPPAGQQAEGDIVLLLQAFQQLKSLRGPLQSQLGCQVVQGTDPFAGADEVGCALNAPVRETEINEGTEYDIIKKTGTSMRMEVPVCDQGLNEFSVNPAAWIVHQLLEFQLIFWHIHLPPA